MASKIEVDTIVNAGGDNDTGIDLATNDTIKFDIAGAEKAQINSSGTLLIGTTDTSIVGDDSSASTGVHLQQDGQVTIASHGGSGLRINRMSDDGASIELRQAGDAIGLIGVLTDRIVMATNGGSGDIGLAMDRSGDVLLPCTNTGSDNDDTVDLGHGSARFDDIFATNGTINTSDQNEKQDIANATTKELNVAKKLSTLFKTFRWKSRVAKKGDSARTHTGIIAQEVQSAFSAEGLDASNYGLFTSHTWTDDDGKSQTRLGVRYPELFSFIFSSIEARLTALESK